MLESILIGLIVILLLILVWPQRRSRVRRVTTKSYNGQHYGKKRELY